MLYKGIYYKNIILSQFSIKTGYQLDSKTIT